MEDEIPLHRRQHNPEPQLTRRQRKRLSEISPLHLHIRSGAPHLGVDALHHGLDLLHGADLVELLDAGLDHVTHGRFPQHGARQLLLQELDNLLRRGARLDGSGGGVHVDRVVGRFHLRQHLVERLPERFLSGLHELRVEATRSLQDLRLQGSGLLCKILQLQDGLLGAGAGEALGEELIGDLANRSLALVRLSLLAELLQLGLLDTSHREHSLLASGSGLLHGNATDVDELQAILEIEHPGVAERSVLSQRKARPDLAARHRLLTLAAKLLHASEAGNEHRGLAKLRLFELGLGARKAEFQDVPTQDRLRLGEHLHDLGDVPHSGKHLHVLRTLAREEETHRNLRRARSDGRRRGTRGLDRDLLLLVVIAHGPRAGAVLHWVETAELRHSRAARQSPLRRLLGPLEASVNLRVVALARRSIEAVRSGLLSPLQDLYAIIPTIVLGVLQRRLTILGVLAVGHAFLDMRVRLRPKQQLHALSLPRHGCHVERRDATLVLVDVSVVEGVLITSCQQFLQGVVVALVGRLADVIDGGLVVLHIPLRIWDRVAESAHGDGIRDLDVGAWVVLGHCCMCGDSRAATEM
mmetsp:Transcript_74687/g.165197  ORF Transcript_74687/g.165197 Transcript_74687/m.165197 type:complete len:583 (+) Transcript_74687:86-1834(+)